MIDRENDGVTLRISRYSSNKQPYTGISVRLEDSKSGLLICAFKMTLEQLAMVITGGDSGICDYEFSPTEFTVNHIRKTREVKSMFCEKLNWTLDSKINQGHVVRQHFAEFKEQHPDDGWILHDDGTSSQQPNKQHKYSIMRFVGGE